MTPTSIAGYLTLFVAVGFLFLFVNLLVGRFLRPNAPSKEKLEVYECGESTIGSSFVQFDLRFYVVALLFLIFDVEVAFFFPWAVVFGKAVNLSDPRLEKVVAVSAGDTTSLELAPPTAGTFLELGVPTDAVLDPSLTAAQNAAAIESTAHHLAGFSILDIGMFFAVLLVGFFYVWRRGDIDWVRALSVERAQADRPRAPASPDEAMLAA